MNLINQITTSPYQQQTFTLDDGSSFTMTLYFVPLQQGWFITELTYQTFILRGIRVTNSPNFLNQFRNIIPFGLGCISVANREPSLQQDFSSGNSKLYILSKLETEEFAEYLRLG